MGTRGTTTAVARAARISAAVLAATVLLAGCGGGGKTAAPENTADSARISVQGTTVSAGTLMVRNVTAGTVSAVTESSVAARTAGTVSRLYRKSGDWVKTGAPVIQLDDTQLKLDLKTAQSNLESAKIDLSTAEDTTTQANPKLELQVSSAQAAVAAAQKKYDGQKVLLDLGGATATDVDTALSDLQTAQANLQAAKTSLDQNKKAPTTDLAKYRLAVEKAENTLEQSKLNLQYATIKAPFAGQISSISVQLGEYVQASSTAFSLVSAEREIEFNIPPTHASRLPIGTKLTFTFGGKSSTVSVKQEPSAAQSGTVPMVATAPQNAPSLGSVGTLTYSVPLAIGTLVPVSALYTQEDKSYVYVVDGGKASLKQVTILAESGITAAVNGVDSGAVVVENPPPGLLSGSAVEVVTNDESQAGEALSE
ncbi:MAG TPA: HlyD family efflux transporter periplasmic adaptor subunit [Spirochaetia bacterium]